jgi:hypothetical protein
VATNSFIYAVKDYAVVMRGKAPTFHTGGFDGDEDDEDLQVRYWSICKIAIPSSKTVSCVHDAEATLDEQGRYVVLVAPDRPTGTGFDYLDFGPGPMGLLALRNMLPSPSFYNMSVQNVKYEANDTEIRATLGEFYPDTRYCKISTIEDQGVEECFL